MKKKRMKSYMDFKCAIGGEAVDSFTPGMLESAAGCLNIKERDGFLRVSCVADCHSPNFKECPLWFPVNGRRAQRFIEFIRKKEKRS